MYLFQHRGAGRTFFGYCDNCVRERTGAAASVKRWRREPTRAISPECPAHDSATPLSACASFVCFMQSTPLFPIRVCVPLCCTAAGWSRRQSAQSWCFWQSTKAFYTQGGRCVFHSCSSMFIPLLISCLSVGSGADCAC